MMDTRVDSTTLSLTLDFDAKQGRTSNDDDDYDDKEA